MQFIILLLTSVLSWALVRSPIPQLRRRLLDQPNERSSHNLPTPSGGGIVFVAVVSVSCGMTLLTGHVLVAAALPLLAAPLAVVGLLDDRFNLPASWRYGVQLLTAALVLCFSHLVQSLGLSVASGNLSLLAFLFLLLITVTAVINFTNFMDGLDGLVAGCMTVTIAALLIVLDAPAAVDLGRIFARLPALELEPQGVHG